MLHKTLAAETTVTDQDLGQFEALVSAWDADREGDVIMPTAFDETIAAWRESGKNLPLLFEHSTEDVGYIDPSTMRATRAGLTAAGQIDRGTERGQQAWRMIKSGIAGFSIGFLSESTPRKGGGNELTSIDLLEVSITSKPMNAATRALSWKSADRDRDHHRDEMLRILTDDPEFAQRSKAARLGVDELARRGQPVKVASFEC